MWISRKKWEFMLDKMYKLRERIAKLEVDISFHDIPSPSVPTSGGRYLEYSQGYTNEQMERFKFTDVKSVLKQLMDELGYELIKEPAKASQAKITKIDVTKI